MTSRRGVPRPPRTLLSDGCSPDGYAAAPGGRDGDHHRLRRQYAHRFPFVLRGNVVDLAVAVVIAGAFGLVITAFTDGVVAPLLAAVGSADTPGLGFFLRAQDAATFVDLGAVVSAIVNFLIVAAVVYFVIVLPMNRLLARRRAGQVEEVEATPEDVALLQEIRDLLAERRGQV